MEWKIVGIVAASMYNFRIYTSDNKRLSHKETG